MSVRPTNTGIVPPRQSAADKVTEKVTEKLNTVQEKANKTVDNIFKKLPERLESSFERSGEKKRTYSKSGSTERDMYTPKLGTKGAGGIFRAVLGNMPAITKEG